MVWHASETPKQHSRKSYQIGNTIKIFSKTVIFTCKSWIFDNKNILYELKRVQTLLKMIIDHSLASLALDSSGETKNWVSEN